MPVRIVLVILTLGVWSSDVAMADTVYLKNGVQVHGRTVSQGDGVLVLDVNGKRIVYRDTEIVKLERNARTGQRAPSDTLARVIERNARIAAISGLERDARLRVDALLRAGNTDDPQERRGVVAELVAFGQEVDILPYLNDVIASLTPRPFTVALEAYATLASAEQARSLALRFASHLSIAKRAASIRVLGKVHDPAVTETVARGLVDPAAPVRLAAAAALAETEDRRATPVLLAAFDESSAAVQASVRRALESIWADHDTPGLSATASEWRAFWESNAQDVPDPIASDAIVPLVDPDERYVEG